MKTLRERTSKEVYKDLIVVPSKLNDIALLGAAALAFEQI
jgi:hypothetical protein